VEGLEMSFWKGKRVFVTGHTGFKGGWLATWLEHLGATVHGYSLEPNTKPSLFQALHLETSTTSTIGDIRDLAKLKSAFEAAKPDIVFHLAAQPLVRRSYVDPLETYSTNVMGTANLLDVIRTSARPCVVVVATTDKVYENREWCWPYRETEMLGGYDPYSSSKAAAEIVVAAYRRSFFHPEKKSQHRVSLASARAGNVIGGGDWSEDRLLPDMVRAFHAGEPVRLRNPNSTRPWQHVLEPLSAYLSLARQMAEKPPAAFDAYNFGPRESDCWPVGRIVENFSKAWGPEARFEIDKGEHVHEAGFLQLDSSKAKAELGWQPKWNLETALIKTADWYKAFAQNPGQNSDLAREITLRQIREWESS
jgi:CDP-glucose 4,6-dehydratase